MLVIDEIRTTSSLIKADQQIAREFNRQSHAQLDLLTAARGGRADIHRLLETESDSSRDEASVGDRGTISTSRVSTKAIEIRTHTQTKTWCSASCSCTCHVTTAVQSPKFFRQIIGIMFIGYTGHPFWSGKTCTVDSCSRPTIFQGYVHYYFPSRILSKAILATLLINSQNQIFASLTVRRIIPLSNEVMQLQHTGDVDGMKRLFRLGLASPNDCTEYGDTLLLVRKHFEYDRSKLKP